MKIEQILRSAVLAGICIGIAGFGYLADEKGIVGAVLFAFGLLTVVSYSLKLYTGTAGFIKKRRNRATAAHIGGQHHWLPARGADSPMQPHAPARHGAEDS